MRELERWVTIEEAAQFLHCKPERVMQLCFERLVEGEKRWQEGRCGLRQKWALVRWSSVVQYKRRMQHGIWVAEGGCRLCGLIAELDELGRCEYCRRELAGESNWYPVELLRCSVNGVYAGD